MAAQADSNLLVTFIRGEHPQTIALIVSYLDPQKASRLLADLPASLQADVARRIAVIDRTSPDVIHEVERVLERKFNILEKENTTSVGGIDAIVEVLNLADRSTEKAIMESLEKGYPQLAEEIKRRMFVFEDIVLLREKDVRKIFERCVKQDLLLAVKAVSEEVKSFILRNLPEGFRKGFAEEVAALDRVRLNEVEAAQQRIVNVIREMELNGEVIVARSDEQLV
jgi:flagellar motor switch protein FliG